MWDVTIAIMWDVSGCVWPQVGYDESMWEMKWAATGVVWVAYVGRRKLNITRVGDGVGAGVNLSMGSL